MPSMFVVACIFGLVYNPRENSLLGWELLLGFVIGLSLGLLGGGGSILMVPALVYLLGLPPQTAVTTSLAVVGVNSLIGASFHRLQGTLNWRIALVFGLVGMLVAYLTSGFSKLIPSTVLLIAFALLMLTTGSYLLLRKDIQNVTGMEKPLWLTLASGRGEVITIDQRPDSVENHIGCND